MNFAGKWSGLMRGFILLSVCAIAAPAVSEPRSQDLQLKYLGAAGWEIRSADTVVLVDPYISRIKYDGRRRDDDPRRDFAMTDQPLSDHQLIDKLVTRADFILVHHNHVDHVIDVPYIAKKTGAKVIGTETTKNILLSYGIPEQQLYAVQGGEDYQFGAFSVRVVPSLHSALGEKRYFSSKRYAQPLQNPLQLSDFIEGGSLMYLLRMGGREVLTMGSMNFIERELQGLRPDVLLAGAGSSRTEIYRYTERLLAATGYPKVVIPTHWDDFFVPYQNEAAQARAREEKAYPFVREVAGASPKSKVIVPVHLEPIFVGGRTE
ncbi:MBL fold metallo-hydrolase [Steroidobacter sp.]|uniref:MBL fold metallo-hydrolase n=1 Tax=Steroidobacter sp. TaxID=1978227 RepID=UPI001A4BF3F2|nr:MBL fold metallo-hydrolase [Steroidobacter sp.]MBL8264855.1 MBL fold metallo-hydrolase [Steroidobacter sp.]